MYERWKGSRERELQKERNDRERTRVTHVRRTIQPENSSLGNQIRKLIKSYFNMYNLTHCVAVIGMRPFGRVLHVAFLRGHIKGKGFSARRVESIHVTLV